MMSHNDAKPIMGYVAELENRIRKYQQNENKIDLVVFISGVAVGLVIAVLIVFWRAPKLIW